MQMSLHQFASPVVDNAEEACNNSSNNIFWESFHTGTNSIYKEVPVKSNASLPVRAPSFRQFSGLYAGLDTISLQKTKAMNSQIPPDLLEVVREMTTLLIHRYRSPLTGVMGFIDLLKTNTNSINEHYMETIMSGLNEMSGLLDEMEELSQEKIAHSNPVSFAKQLKNILEEYPKHEQSRIHIFDYSDKEELLADKELLKTILSALLDNALEHDRSANTDILIEIHKNKRCVITNFGTPIPSDFTLKMFYPFYSTKSRNMGLGLTKASIAAQTQNWIIKLISNSEVDGISFEIVSNKNS